MTVKEQIEQQRKFMHSNFSDWDKIVSDQQKKKPYPTLEKEVEKDAIIIALPSFERVKDNDGIKDKGLTQAIVDRVSHRQYSEIGLTLDQLSYLLYCTQGVKSYKEKRFSKRTVPSGGARHPFETYLVIERVEGLEKGLYRYLPFSHSLVLIESSDSLADEMITATLDQKFAGEAAVNFIWAAMAYRCEWRYNISAHKTMLLDVGHICQNLYIACEAIGAGTCGIAAYDQRGIDELIKVDGVDEFAVYLAPVGMKKN